VLEKNMRLQTLVLKFAVRSTPSPRYRRTLTLTTPGGSLVMTRVHREKYF